MSRARITIVAFVLASAAAALVAAVAGAGGSAAPTTMTLVAVDLPKTEIYIDTGKKGESPGDTVLVRERMHRGSRSGPVVGRTEVVCTLVSERGSRCHVTLILSNGTLEAAGSVAFAGPTVRIPIVGGTKGYAGARGEIRFTELGEKATRYLVTLVD